MYGIVVIYSNILDIIHFTIARHLNKSLILATLSDFSFFPNHLTIITTIQQYLPACQLSGGFAEVFVDF